jgi:hypothetical protein
MGWADCGDDSQGRPIGYAFEATCDYPGCDEKIDRGLSFACGDMHGQTEYGCEEYFCNNHLNIGVTDPDGKSVGQLCPACYDRLILDDDERIIGDKENGLLDTPKTPPVPAPDGDKG